MNDLPTVRCRAAAEKIQRLQTCVETNARQVALLLLAYFVFSGHYNQTEATPTISAPGQIAADLVLSPCKKISIPTMKNGAAQSTIANGLSGARWQLFASEAALLHRLQQETSEPLLILRCLLQRGLTTASQVKDFLQPDFQRHRHAPELLRDMTRAVARLRQAIAQRERILIVTDFDVDGTTSSVI